MPLSKTDLSSQALSTEAQGSNWYPRTNVLIDLFATSNGAVAGLVGKEGGVVSEVINLESSDVEAPDRRPHHDEYYHEA